ERIAPDTIRLERVLDAPAETVWRYLTEADKRRDWFMGGTDASPGGEFDLVVDHDNLSDQDKVPYPESYEKFKGAVWTEKVIRFFASAITSPKRGSSRILSKSESASATRI